MKRGFVLLLALLLAVSMSGCSFMGIDTQMSISPPKANADQQEIHRLLQGDSAELKFIYPKSGEYRSAIIMKDFTGDGQEDAVGFTWTPAGVRVHFLVKEKKDGWQLIADFDNSATQVDRVCFGDLYGDGRTDVLIGWGNAQNSPATLGAYHYDRETVSEEIFDAKYDEMMSADFNGDGVLEIFMIQTVQQMLTDDESGGLIPAAAQVYTLKGGSATVISETEANNDVTIFTSIKFGHIADDIPGIVIDGTLSDGRMTTQAFYLDRHQKLWTIPRYPNDPEVLNPFIRPAGSYFSAMDINKDGIIELPAVKKLPAIPKEVRPDSTSYLVEWNTPMIGDDVEYRTVLSTFINTSAGYWFKTPSWLKDELTAISDPDEESVTYYRVKKDEGENGETEYLLGPRMFSVKVFSSDDWKQLGDSSRYEMLEEYDNMVYGILIYTRENKYISAVEKIKEEFHLFIP